MTKEAESTIVDTSTGAGEAPVSAWSDVERNGMRFEWLDPRTLTPNAKNPRKHPGKQRRAVEAGLQELGWLTPLVMNSQTGNLIDGHLRREEAIEKNLPEVPVIILDVPKEKEAAALGIIDKVSSMATYDEAMNREIIEATRAVDAELAALVYEHSDDDFEDVVDDSSADDNADPQSIGLVPGEELNYVMLVFRESVDWVAAVDHFGLKEQQDPLFTKTRKVGVGRVIDGAEYLSNLFNRKANQ